MAKSVYDRIISLELPYNVQKEAIAISDKIKTTHRKGKRLDAVTFFSVFEGYRTAHKIFNPCALADTLGIKYKKINKILKSYYRSGFKPILVHYTPHEFVPEHSLHANIPSDEYKHVYALIDRLLTKYPLLYEKTPQDIAGGATLYYAYIHGYITDKAKCASCLSACNGKKSLELCKIEKLICLLDNEPAASFISKQKQNICIDATVMAKMCDYDHEPLVSGKFLRAIPSQQ